MLDLTGYEEGLAYGSELPQWVSTAVESSRAAAGRRAHGRFMVAWLVELWWKAVAGMVVMEELPELPECHVCP